jgi:hypothetical protein
MRSFISNYELTKLILEGHQYQDMHKTLLNISQQLCDITIFFGTKLQYMLLY